MVVNGKYITKILLKHLFLDFLKLLHNFKMQKNKKKILKIAIDSPAAAGAGTLAKAISKELKRDE